MASRIDIDFDADEFMALSKEERIKACLLLADRAQALAAEAQPSHKQHYLAIAQEWLNLADAMRRALAEDEHRARAH